jgi:putative sigma-54 modulation protein
MRLELTGRHVDITPALRRMLDRKLARLERMLNDSAVSAQIVLSREKRGQRIDLTLHARGEKFLHGFGGPAATWQMAVSQAVAKIVQQAHKVKGKWQERKRRGSKTDRRAEELPRTATGGTPTQARPRMPKIFRASRQALKAMSVSDAVREVEANGEGIIVFRDAETADISVLYRRASGELTLVQTEA